MADDKTTKTPEQPVTDSGPGKETPPAPPKEPEKVSVSPEPEKKTEPEVKNPQVSVYNFAEIMKEMAWGELTYAKPLTEKQMEDYELKPAPGNPDRVRPSITARLKEGTRGQDPPKEPGQKRSHKNHEER